MEGYGIGQSTQYTTWSTNVVAPQAMTMTHVPPPYEDYTGRAMFAAFCCCWPLGLCALIKASEARKSYQVGDSETARSQADQARQLSNISIGVGCASFVLLFTFIVLYYTKFAMTLTSNETDAPSAKINLQKE
uniref:Proline-rich transmembrane protein 1 n=1 Tax=Magallana gigas TaxID=29159 RepID=K1QM26_MAGGI